MTKLAQLLRENQEAILRRWLEAALSSYAAVASAAFAKQADPFANPIGHSLRLGTREIFQQLLAEADPGALGRHLDPILSIRAVQEMSASEAVGFVFGLKAAVRAELGPAAGQADLADDLAKLDAAVDRVALTAFDLYVEYRERISQVRVQAANRRVSWIVQKLNESGSDSTPSI
jgi:hypothetical protein